MASTRLPELTAVWGNNSSAMTTESPFSARGVEGFELFCYIVIMVGAFVANIVAITTILRTKALRSNPHNYLILSLNIIDLGVTLLSMTFSVASFADGGAYLDNSDALCHFNGFFAMTFTVGNFTTTFVIAIDRYLTVVWSTRFPPTKRRAFILLAYSWILAMLFAIFPTVGISADFKYTHATHHCSPAWESCGYFYAWFFHIYALILPVMVFCYWRVFDTIRVQEKRLNKYGLGKASAQTSSSASGANIAENFRAVDDSGSGTDGTPRSNRVVRNVDIERPVWNDNSASVEFSEDESSNLGAVKTGKTVNDSGKNKAFFFKRDFGVKFNTGYESSDTEMERGRSSDTFGSAADDDAKKKKKNNKEKRRLMKLQNLSTDRQVAITGVMLVLTTFVCWTPYNIVHAHCFWNIGSIHFWDSVTMLVGYLNALLDPLIYTFMNRRARAATAGYLIEFKNALVGMCARCMRKLHPAEIGQ